jgi:ubiquinone/menaquinone biosynthesis C-methylase UbiE
MTKTRKALYQFYLAMQKILAPGLNHSQCDYKKMLRAYIRENSRWLDLGCGQEILPGWLPSSHEEQNALVKRSKMIVGLDHDYVTLQKQKYIKHLAAGDIQNLPFRDGSLNLVTANMVVEHLKEPDKALAEVYRILEPNGCLIFHTPNVLNYATLAGILVPVKIRKRVVEFLEDREEADIFPVYYRMNSPKTIKNLASSNGFNIIELKVVESSAYTFMLGPIVLIELLIIRILRFKPFACLRSNIIAVFQKPDGQSGGKKKP